MRLTTLASYMMLYILMLCMKADDKKKCSFLSLPFLSWEAPSPRTLGILFQKPNIWCFQWKHQWPIPLVPSPLWIALKKPLLNSLPINSTSLLPKTPCPPNWTNFFSSWPFFRPLNILYLLPLQSHHQQMRSVTWNHMTSFNLINNQNLMDIILRDLII